MGVTATVLVVIPPWRPRLRCWPQGFEGFRVSLWVPVLFQGLGFFGGLGFQVFRVLRFPSGSYLVPGLGGLRFQGFRVLWFLSAPRLVPGLGVPVALNPKL
jgi:hypothetical protein